MRVKLLLVAMLVPLFMGGAVQAAANTPAGMLPPDQVVSETAKDMFSAVNQRREELKSHPQELYKVVGDVLLPHFDFDYASRLVLGRYWRSATPEQRKAFEDAFYKFLVHSYADGILKGNYSERDVKVQPWRGSDSDTRTMIRSQVLLQNASPVEVDYAMVKTKDGWKAFDVTVEGISYVMNYRNQFGSEIEQNGLDALIKRLNADADKTGSHQPEKKG